MRALLTFIGVAVLTNGCLKKVSDDDMVGTGRVVVSALLPRASISGPELTLEAEIGNCEFEHDCSTVREKEVCEFTAECPVSEGDKITALIKERICIFCDKHVETRVVGEDHESWPNTPTRASFGGTRATISITVVPKE